MQLTERDIQRAAEAIRGSVVETPCLYSQTLSGLVGAEVFLKFENLQFTASFKERGALVKLLSLSENERRRGVIAMSAGNHAQAVAYHARRMAIQAVIVMPRFTPTNKVEQTRGFGAEVILHGEEFDEAIIVDEILERIQLSAPGPRPEMQIAEHDSKQSHRSLPPDEVTQCGAMGQLLTSRST